MIFGLMPFTYISRIVIIYTSFPSSRIWSVAFNKFHDQLLLSSSSDNLVNLQSVVSISSAAYGAYEDEEDDDEDDQSLDHYSNTREYVIIHSPCFDLNMLPP